MKNKGFTIPKNLLLNWLYSSDKNISLDKLGKWIELNTNGKYKLVDLRRLLEIKGNDLQSCL